MKKKNLNWLLALLAALALVFAFAGCADNGAGDTTDITDETNPSNPSDGTNPGDDEEEEDTPCCDTSGCERGANCTVCDSCETCQEANCCGEGAAEVEPEEGCNTCQDTCTVTESCTGEPGCEACAEADPSCDCDDCAKTEINLVYFKAFVESLGTVETDETGAYWSFAGGSWSDMTYTLVGTGSSTVSAQISAGTVEDNVKGLGKVTSTDGLLEVDFSDVGWEDDTATGSTPGQIKVTVKIAESATDGSYEIDGTETSLNDLSSEGIEVILVFDASDVTSYTGDKWTT